MILVDRYKRQIAALLLLASTTGLLPSVDILAASIDTTTGLPATADIPTAVAKPDADDSDTTNNIITLGEYGTIEDNLITAINYLQELHVSALGGIEYNGGAALPDPSGGTDATASETYVAADNPAYLALKDLSFDSISGTGFLANLVSLSSQLTTLNTNVAAIQGLPGTGHTYQAELAKLVQLIDAVDAHMDITGPSSLVDLAHKVNSGELPLIPVEPESLFVSSPPDPPEEKTTTEIHVSEYEGDDIPVDKYWITKTIYDDLTTALNEATDIAQKAHQDALFATETLLHTVTTGIYSTVGTGASGNTILQNGGADYSTTTKILKPDELPYGTAAGTDLDYSDAKELGDAFKNLEKAYESFVDGADLGEGTYASQVHSGEAEIKMALAMGGFPVTDTGATKSLSTILTNLGGTPTLAEANQVFLYTRKATAAEVGAGNVTGTALNATLSSSESLLIPGTTAVTLTTDIVTTKDKAEDITLYVNPPDSSDASADPTVDYLKLSDIAEGDNYFITPAVKDDATHVGNWTPGGEFGGESETEGKYITNAEATAHIEAVKVLLTDYQNYDGKDTSFVALTDATALNGEVKAALTPSAEDEDVTVLQTKIDEITAEIEKVSALFKEGTKDAKDSANLDLMKLMIHLGFVSAAEGATPSSDPDVITFKTDADFILKPSTESGIIVTDGATILSESTTSFDYTDHEDTKDLSTFATENANANIRTYHNVSILSGYDLPDKTGAAGSEKAVTWVTPEVNDALYKAAKKVYDKMAKYKDAIDSTGKVTNSATYDAISTEELITMAEDLQDAIDTYDHRDSSEDGRSKDLTDEFNLLFGAIHGDAVGAGSTKGAADHLTLANGSTPRALTDTALTLSDEGIFAIIKEAIESTSTPAEIKLMSNAATTAPTHWVTPEEVDALETPLTTATTLFTLLDNIIDGTDSTDAEIIDFTSAALTDATVIHELKAFAKFLSDKDEDEDSVDPTLAAKYDIAQISTDLSTELTTFEEAIKKTVLDPAKYVTLRNPLRLTVWGNPDSTHTSTGADTTSPESPTNPAALSARALVKTETLAGSEKIVYLDPAISKVVNLVQSASPVPLVVSTDGGATYVEYDSTTKKLVNKGLISAMKVDDGSGNLVLATTVKWISQDDLNTYNAALEAAEKVLEDSAPTVKTASDPEAKKIEEAQLATITTPANVTTYTEVKFEQTFLDAIATNPDYIGTEAAKLNTATTGATDVFKAAFKTGPSAEVTGAITALETFKVDYGTTNAGYLDSSAAPLAPTSNNPANGYVTAATEDSNTSTLEAGAGILANFYAIKDGSGKVTSYFPIGVHQSEDGFLNVDKDGFIDETVLSKQGASDVITKYVTKAEITAVSKALLAIDKVLAEGDEAIIAKLVADPQYLDKQMATLEVAGGTEGALNVFEAAKKPSKSAAYQAAFGALEDRIDTESATGTSATDLNAALAGNGSAAPTTTVSVTNGVVTVVDSSTPGTPVVKTSDNGKNGLSDGDEWVTPTMLTNLETAVKAVYDLVQEASDLTSLKDAKKHMTAYETDPNYFTTLAQSTALDSAISGFVVKTFTAPDATQMHLYVNELEKALYGDDQEAGGANLDSGVSSLAGNEDALSLAILTEMEKNNQTLPVSLKVLDATYVNGDVDGVLTKVAAANILLDADTDGELDASDNGGPNDILAGELYDLTVELAEKTGTLEVTAESPEVALHDLYLTAKDILVYEDPDDSTKTKDVVADDLAGAKTATADYWLPSKQLEDIQEAIAEAAEIFDKQYSSATTFEKEVAKAMEELEEVNAYEPQPGTLDPDAANALLAAKSSLLDSINRAAHLRGDLAYMEDGTPNPNTAIDPTVIVVDSKLLGTDVLMTHRWTSTMERNKLLSAMNAALGTYNSGKSVTEDYNSAILSLDTSIDTFESNAKPGVKEDYESYVKSLAVYVDTMTNGNYGYTSADFATQKPIPAIDDIQSATNGAGTLPTDYWATQENIDTIKKINTTATNILENEANILEGKIELTLEELKAEYAKIPPAFEAFYGRKIDDGTEISGAVAHIQAGTKGFVTKKIEDAIATAKTTINGLYFIGASIDAITNPEDFTLNNFDPSNLPSADFTVVSSMADGADAAPASGLIVVSWVPVSYVKAYADAVESAELALQNYNDVTGTVSEEILKALDTNVLALKTAATNLGDNTKVVSTTLSPEAAALQTAKTELSDALVEANALIGKLYTPSDDEIGEVGTASGMTTNTGLEVTDDSIALIGNSPSGYGTEFTADPVQNWVPKTNFEVFERAITSAIASKNSANATATSLINAEANLKAAAERIIATAKLKGPGEKEKFDEQKLILQGLIDKANLMRYGATSDDDIIAYTAAWGTPIGKDENDDPIAYPLMLSNRNGTDVSKQAYWASAIAYNKFVNAITVAENVISNPLSNIKSIEAQIKALGDSRTGAINSILVYGKPRKGTSSSTVAEATLIKNALKVELDKANALAETKTSDKGGRDIIEGTPWVSTASDAIAFATDKNPIEYLKDAIDTADTEYKDETSTTAELTTARTDLTDAIAGFMNAFANKDSGGNASSANPAVIFGGDHSDPANKIGVDGTANAIADAKVIFNIRYEVIEKEFGEIIPLELVSATDLDSDGNAYGPAGAATENAEIAKANGLKVGDKYADSDMLETGGTTPYDIMKVALATAKGQRDDKVIILTVAELIGDANETTVGTVTTTGGAIGTLNTAYTTFDPATNVFTVGSAGSNSADTYKKIGDLIVELLTEDDSPLVVPYHAVTDLDAITGAVAGDTIDTNLATYLVNVLKELINDDTLDIVVTAGSVPVGTAATATENANYSGFTVAISDATPSVVYTIGATADKGSTDPYHEADLYVEIDKPKTNAATKMDVLRAASILDANRNELNLTLPIADIATATEIVKKQLEKLLTDANFVLDDPDTIAAGEEEGMTVSVTSTIADPVPSGELSFDVSIKSPIAFSPVALMSASDIDTKIDETFTTTHYTVTFKTAFNFKVTPTAVNGDDTTAVGKAKSAIEDATNAAAIIAIDKTKQYTQLTADQAILNKVTKILDNTPGAEEVRAAVIADGSGFAIPTYDFVIRLSKGLVTENSAPMQVTGLIAPATAQTMNLITVDDGFEVAPVYDNYFDFYDNDDYELELEYEYNSEFEEEYLVEDNYYYNDNYDVEYFDNYDNNYDSNYGDDSYYYDDSNGYNDGFEEDYFEEPGMYDFDNIPEFEEELILKKNMFEKIASIFNRFIKR